MTQGQTSLLMTAEQVKTLQKEICKQNVKTAIVTDSLINCTNKFICGTFGDGKLNMFDISNSI